MSLLSSLKSKVEDIRLIPPTKDPPNDNDERSPDPSKPQRQHQPTLQITSYDRFTASDPKPDLEYDCRMTKNPARQARQTHTGLDDKVQDELMKRNEFSDLIDLAEEEIRKLMEVSVARAKGEDDAAIVRVGCLCGSGHHRSVAFAEQLGKIEWPADWHVSVDHRNLTEGIKEEKREKEKTAVRESKERNMAEDEHQEI